MNTNYALGTVLVAEGTKKRKKKSPCTHSTFSPLEENKTN